MYLIRFNPALPCRASLRPSLRDFNLQFYTIYSALFSLRSTYNTPGSTGENDQEGRALSSNNEVFGPENVVYNEGSAPKFTIPS
jgi:hypothetical protein